MADNIFKTLGSYVTEVLDNDKDGAVSFKELLGIFPNNAVAIAFLVVDLLVLVAEYRVWDVGLTITGGDPYKALGFVLVSAVPFYLGQIMWLYPRANKGQQTIAVILGAAGLYASAQFGLADLSISYDVAAIVQMVIYGGVAFIISLLIYIVIDDSVKANRLKVTSRAKAAEQRERNAITRSVLADLRESMEEEEKLKRDFDPVAVQAQLDRLRGNKGKGKGNQNTSSTMPRNDTQTPQNAPAKQETSYTLQDYLDKSGMSLSAAQTKFGGKRYSDFAEDFKMHFADATRQNMQDAFYELIPNPTQPVTDNHRH